MRLQLPGTSFSAWVLVDGVEVDIFEQSYMNDQNGQVARCWIASEAGKTFSIYCCDNERKHPSRGVVYVDGVRCMSGLLLRKNDHPGDTIKVEGYQTSGTTARYLTFSSLETTDDDDGLTNTQVGSIGEIKVTIEYVETRFSRNQISVWSNPVPEVLGQNQKVNEKSKKAGSHRAQLGAELALQRGSVYDVVRQIASVGTFIFNYRPRDLLIAQEIIPRPIEQRKSPAVELELHISDNDAEEEAVTSEISKLQDKLRNIREGKRKRVKVESDTDSRRVKREKLNVPLAVQGEVLDLTELSD